MAKTLFTASNVYDVSLYAPHITSPVDVKSTRTQMLISSALLLLRVRELLFFGETSVHCLPECVGFTTRGSGSVVTLWILIKQKNYQ